MLPLISARMASAAATLPSLAGGNLPQGEVKASYTAVFKSGGVAPLTFSISSGKLPTGLTLAAVTGALSGVPTVKGSFTFTVKVVDSSPARATASANYTLSVLGVLSVSGGSLPAGTAGSHYSGSFAASGGLAPYTYTITSGALPATLTLTSATGSLYGVTTSAGVSHFTVTAKDALGGSAASSESIDVDPELTAPAQTLPQGTVGSAYHASLSIAGGHAPYNCSVYVGSLPPGLSLSQCVVSGTPSAKGSFGFKIKVTDSTVPANQVVSSDSQVVILIPTVAATPVLSLSSAGCPWVISMADASPGVTIYYTTDGSTPTPSSSKYKGPIGAVNVVAGQTIQAMATGPDNLDSAVALLKISQVGVPPTFFPLPGPYTIEPGNVTLGGPSGSVIYFTLDGTKPTTKSAIYRSAISVVPAANSTETIQAIAVTGGLTSCTAQASYTFIPPSSATSIASISVDPTSPGRLIPADFAGLSVDHNEIARWGGPSGPCGGVSQPACTMNPIYGQLLNNLIVASNGTLSLRVEGDSAMAPDNTNYGGAYYNNCETTGTTQDYPQTAARGDITSFSLIGPLKALMQPLKLSVILGIDLGCNHAGWAATEALNYYNGLGTVLWNKVAGIEIGNEPDNYIGQGFRCNGYTFVGVCGSQSYMTDIETWQNSITKALPNAKIAFIGPSTAGSAYNAGVEANLGAGFSVDIVSQHNYPLPNEPICGPGQTVGCDAPDLLLQSASVYGSHGGPNLYLGYLNSVHQTSPGTKFRIGEFNDIANGGKSGISDTFQAALWLLDSEFLYASLGYDGTNVHTGQYITYNLWQFQSNTVLRFIKPEYYGLLAFEMVAGNHASLIPAQTTTSANLTSWATLDGAGNVHVVVINKDEVATGTVNITVPGYTRGSATLLTAPSYVSQCLPGSSEIGCSSGVSLGQSTFDGSTNGKLVNWSAVDAKRVCPLSPENVCWQELTGASGNTFTATIPITSALLITLKP